MELIYKIVPAQLWHQAELVGTFAGSPVDLSDGQPLMELRSAAQINVVE